MKKFISLFSAFTLCFLLIPQIKAESFAFTTDDGFNCVIENNEVKITYFPGIVNEELHIPAEIQGYPVTVLGENSFRGCDNMTGVYIPNTVKIIEKNAFYGCSKISNLVIGNSVTEIGDFAFSGCQALTDLAIPDSVEKIGEYAFSYCDSLLNIELGSSLKVIGNYAFSFSSEIKNVILPTSLETLGANVFSECSGLENIRINKSLSSIGKDAFYPCVSLKNFQIVNGNQFFAVRNGVLYNKGRTELLVYPQGKEDVDYVLAETVTKINEDAFKNVAFLQNLTVPVSLENLTETDLSGCNNLKTVTYLGDEAEFFNMSGTSLKNYDVKIGEKLIERVTSDEKSDENYKYGFYNGGVVIYEFSGDTEPYIPTDIEGKEVIIIAENAFSENTAITNLVIPDTVKYICENAFLNCNEITDVSLGKSVLSIGENVFKGCVNLTKASYNGTPDDWAKITFKNKDSNPAFFTNKIYFGKELIENIVLSEGITEIKPYSFCCFGNLESILLPSGITEIGESAFEFCDLLTQITIPEGVTKIENNAFFYSALESADIPKTLNSIGDFSFALTNIESIVIPRNVIYLGNNVFSECFYLTDIYVKNTETNWQELNYRSENDYTGIIIHFYDFYDKVKNMICFNEENETMVDGMFIYTESIDNINSYSNILNITSDDEVKFSIKPSYVYGETELYGTGSNIKFFDENGYEVTYDIIVSGDLTGDGVIDVLDCAITEMKLHVDVPLESNLQLACDTTKDGKITVEDYLKTVNKALS